MPTLSGPPHRWPLALAILFAAAAAPVAAQQEARPPDPAHEQAVLELFELMEMEAHNRATLRTMTTSTTMAGTPVADVMQRFVERYLSWDVVRPRLVQVYADELTPADVRDLIAFYRSPIGRRLVAVMPEINRRSIEATSQLVAEHQAELQAMLQEAIRAGPPR